jgi:hypothetical protein
MIFMSGCCDGWFLSTDGRAQSCLTVIPAKAGIQSKYASEGHNIFMLSAAHNVFALDSGLRRIDDEAAWAIVARDGAP